MTLNLILLIVAAVFALPGGLFASLVMSEPRARLASVVGGILGSAIVAVGIYYYINSAHVNVDALSYWIGSFFGCSVGVVVGALVANFLVGMARGGNDYTPQEY